MDPFYSSPGAREKMRKVPFNSFRNEETEPPLSPPVDEAAAARNNTTMWSVDLTARQTFGISPRSKYIQKAEEGEGFETPSSWQKEDNGNGSRSASSSWAIWNKQHQQHKKTSKNYRNLLTTGGIVLAVVAVTAAGGSYAAKANASVVARAATATKAPTISCKSSKAPTSAVKSYSKNPTVKRSKAPKSASVPCVGGPVTESPSVSAAPSASSQPSLESCVPGDGEIGAACTDASPTIRQGSCIGGRACVNTASVQSIGIGSCVGDPDFITGKGVCEDSSGESIGDGSWYVNFDVASLSFFVLFYFNLSPIDNLFLIRLKVWTLQLVLKTRARLVTTVAFLITSMTVGRQHALRTEVKFQMEAVWEKKLVSKTGVRLRTIAVLARLHVLPTKVMSTAVAAWDHLRAQKMQATLDKAVGKDESLLPNSMDMALLLYL
jgi:hypothetical protein